MSSDATQENPLHKRLGIRPGLPGAVIAAPEDSDNPLLPLPEEVVSVTSPGDLPEQDGQFDYIHYFARSRAELTRALPQLRERLAPRGGLWVSWIKQAAAHGGGGLPGDLNENVIRRMALANGLVDVKVATLGQDWSALRLVLRKH
jgi:hypothetical protein